MAKEPARASNGSRAGINDDIGEKMRLTMYRMQVEIRESEQRAFDLFLQNLVKGTSHLSLGQEAVATGFAAAMKPGDLSFCTYRGHAHTLARGVPIEKVLGELMQRDNGLMRGKGGSMHLTSVEHGVMGSYAIIGAHLPIACGAALRAQYRGDSDVTVCFFGDGTTNIGAFHEALNFAAVWKLPVIFVCENNLYMEYTPIGDVTAVEHGVMGSYAIIGAHLPIACGAAWRAQYKGADDVAVCFFGDGTANIGAFHEALNFAVVWKLPVVFVCENNLYMEYTPIKDVTAVAQPAADRASAYGLARIVIDGNDADEVYRTAQAAFATARAGKGPTLIECMTYRHSGHSRADPAKYRPPGELDAWLKRDPIPRYRARLLEFDVAEETIAGIEADVRREVDEATEKCKAAPMPTAEILMTDVYADGGWAWRN